MNNLFSQLGNNIPLMSAVMGWFLAQLLKVMFVLVTQKRFDARRFVGSGGMPSSHAAFVTSLATAVALVEGAQSTAFAICFVLAFVVIYDATGVRRAAGRQARIINKIVDTIQKGTAEPKLLEKQLNELIGHTPFQVIVGALLGIAVALFLYYIVY